MKATEFAATLAGATYPDPISKEHAALAKVLGLVIVYGASDDLMEFEGAIHDEFGAYNGAVARLTATGLLTNECEDDDCPYFAKLQAGAPTIEALWASEGDYSWTFRTAIPHATFEITEDGEPYCRGIVFPLSDVFTNHFPATPGATP